MARPANGYIRLYNDFVVAVDQYNYSLAKIKIKKDKDGNDVEYFDYIAHHSSLDKVLIEFRRYLIREKLSSEINGLTEAIDAIVEIDNRFKAFVEENIPET